MATILIMCLEKYKGLIVLADIYIRYVILDMGVCICVIWMEIDLKSSQNECNEVQWVNQNVAVWLDQGLLYRWTEHWFFLKKIPLGEGSKAPKLHPRDGFFGPWSFIILKYSYQDLSNEGSNFILSSLEVGHWVAQT